MAPPTMIDVALAGLNCRYAFYYRPRGAGAIIRQNHAVFRSASLIKIPLLLAWLDAERAGEVDRYELADLTAEPPVGGSGLAELLTERRLPYADVLLFMIALSDNLCTNLVIRRLGLPRIAALFRDALGLTQTRLERRLMDYAARARGLDNRISAQDCIRLFDLRDGLNPADRAWFDALLLANTDLGLFLRNVPRDTVDFCHKTGNIPGVLHDWGYTEDADMFLLTEDVQDEREVYRALDVLGPLLIGERT